MATTDRRKRNQRRGLLLALGLHSVVLALLIYPFLTGFIAPEHEYETIMLVDFTQSSAAASNTERSRTSDLREKAVAKAAPKVDPRPEPVTAPKAPPAVITTPDPAPEVPETPSTIPEKEISPAPAPTKQPKRTPKAKPTSPVSSSGTAATKSTDAGSPEPGNDKEVADEGEGLAPIGSALEGDGVLARAVVYRPNLDEIVKQNGTVVLNICINQRGKVIGVKWNEERSTIDDTDLVRTAIKKAQRYRFEQDYTAPKRECGTLSIIVDGL